MKTHMQNHKKDQFGPNEHGGFYKKYNPQQNNSQSILNSQLVKHWWARSSDWMYLLLILLFILMKLLCGKICWICFSAKFYSFVDNKSFSKLSKIFVTSKFSKTSQGFSRNEFTRSVFFLMFTQLEFSNIISYKLGSF